MHSLLSNPFFWAGQLGLVLTVIFGMAIIDLNRGRAAWWYITPLWLLAGLAFYNVGQPLIGGHPMPNPSYLLRLAFGLSVTAGYWQTKRRAVDVAPAIVRTANRIVLIGGVVGVIVLALVALAVRIAEQNRLIERKATEDKHRSEAVIRAIQADTAREVGLVRELDSTNALLRRQQVETANAKKERASLKRETSAIKADTKEIKREVKQLSIDSIPHEVPRKKGFFRRLFGRVEPDTTSSNVAHNE